ncbi:hypothetical protein ACWD4V_21365 [Streptomyces tsukubensis]
MSTPYRMDWCIRCGRPVEATEENEVFDGFSASGARPALYAHPDCDTAPPPPPPARRRA